MDRQIVYPGSIPLDTDLLAAQRNAMVALGYLAQATLGANTVVDGMACTPTSPASLTINVGPGCITALTVVDAAAFGTLGADAADPLLKIGVNTSSTSFTLTAPATSGQAINYLLQASFNETDAAPLVLPYYNAANPNQPFSGAQNNGVAQNTQRIQRVQLQLKPSAPANAGTQVTPVVDNGWVGLYVITVNFAQTQVTGNDIAVYPGAPFVSFKLNTLTPGFSRITPFTASGNFVVPNGCFAVKARVCGGGGGGGAGAPGYGGGGGGAGGYAEAIIPVSPGEVLPITVGGGGSPGCPNGPTAGTGGTSTVGSSLGATGGTGGGNAGTFAPGGPPGAGFGGQINAVGGYGSDGNAGLLTFAGNGGASHFGGGGRAACSGSQPQQNGAAYGAGGGACYSAGENGGFGAPGIVIVEY